MRQLNLDDTQSSGVCQKFYAYTTDSPYIQSSWSTYPRRVWVCWTSQWLWFYFRRSGN